jgi:hypothetical protein
MAPRFNIGDRVVFVDKAVGATWGICFVKSIKDNDPMSYLVCDEATGGVVDFSDGSDLILVSRAAAWDSEAI